MYREGMGKRTVGVNKLASEIAYMGTGDRRGGVCGYLFNVLYVISITFQRTEKPRFTLVLRCCSEAAVR